MELKVVHYVSDEDQKIVASRHFIDGEEVAPEDFTELLVDCIESDEDEFEGFEECEDCDDDCNECDLCDDAEEYINDDEEDDDDAEFDMICAWADAINEDLCEAHVYQVVQDIFNTAKKIGYREAKLEIIENLSEDIEDLD